jgi:hypothetical protein
MVATSAPLERTRRAVSIPTPAMSAPPAGPSLAFGVVCLSVASGRCRACAGHCQELTLDLWVERALVGAQPDPTVGSVAGLPRRGERAGVALWFARQPGGRRERERQANLHPGVLASGLIWSQRHRRETEAEKP